MDFKGIEFHDIKKDFSGKPALSGIDLRIQRGTVHSVVGENGAGKSTLMNILNGVFPPSGGFVTLDGEKLALTNPLDALRCGIGMVYQHFMLVDELRVWQNIALGMEETGPLRILDEKKMKARIEAACKEYNFDFDLDSVTGDLPVGERQRIEIFKVLYRKAEYIILDEPTAVLVPEEVERLFESIEAFRRAGKTVIFISHKIEEVLRISDRISVLRRGEHVGTLDRRDATAEKLVNMMVGREIHIDGDPLPTEKGNVVFEMEGVSTAQKGFGCALHDVRFSVRQGEVLGFAGVDGNGQSELVQVLMHLMPISSGAMRFNGQDVTKLSTGELRKKGFSCIPPDRHQQGLVLDSCVYRNMVQGFEDQSCFRRMGLLSPRKVIDRSQQFAEEYDIRMDTVYQDARGLSGGNQQKIILARECGLADPQLVIASNPTRGLDVGAIEFVYQTLERLKADGRSVLLISTELSEIMRLSDRIAVLFKGQIMDVVERGEADIARIGSLMMGIQTKGGGEDA